MGRALVILGLLAGACSHERPALPATAAPPPGPRLISIVGTSDVHGHVRAEGARGGAAALGGYLGNLRRARSHNGGVVLVDAGDAFLGTHESDATEGMAVVAADNALGYAALAIGNHELDFGPVGPASAGPGDDPHGALKALAAAAAFPFLAANLRGEDGGPLGWPNVVPSTIVEVAGVKVGIIGVVTAATPTLVLAENLGGLRVAPPAEALAAEALRVRERGATVVIGVVHAGGACARFEDPADLSSCDPGSELFAIVRSLPAGRVDALVGGHTHGVVAHLVAGVPVVQTGSYGRAFARVDLEVNPRTGSVVGARIFPPQDLCLVVDSEGGCAAEVKGTWFARYAGARVTPDENVRTAVVPFLERAGVR